MTSVINRLPDRTKMVMEWFDGRKIMCELVSLYETDNGLEMDEEGYLEYYAAAFKVLSILFMPENMYSEFRTDQGLELWEWNAPDKVMLENGEVIFKKE